MNTKKSILVVTVGLIAFVTTGCSTLSSTDESDDPIEQQSNIEVVKNKALSIYKVRLKEEDGNTVISGRIRTKGFQRYISGHIDINIENSGGKTLHKLSTEISHKSLHQHHTYHYPRFRVVLEESIPTDARVRVNYHSERENVSQSNACKKDHC